MVEDAVHLIVCLGRCSAWACQPVGLGIVLEKLVADLVPFAF